MDIKKLKASYQLAQMRAKSDPSEANMQILQQAKEEYEFAADPDDSEKKTEDEEQPANEQEWKLEKEEWLNLLDIVQELSSIVMNPPATVSPEPTVEVFQDPETLKIPEDIAKSAELHTEAKEQETQQLEPTPQITEVLTNNPLKKTKVKTAQS